MICESCQKNLATIHLTEIKDKRKVEKHLCEECADSQTPFGSLGEAASTDEAAAGEAFTVEGFLGGMQQEPAKPAKPPVVVPDPCPACGLSFAEFRSTGRLGCHHDYEHFRANLRPLLEKIHGRTQHQGRVPSRIGERLQRQRQLESLQQALSEAVGKEDYERAAELRDQIRALEGA